MTSKNTQTKPKNYSYYQEEDDEELDKQLTKEQLQWCYENL